MRPIEDIAREAGMLVVPVEADRVEVMDAEFLPPSIPTLARFAAILRAEALEEAAAVCAVTCDSAWALWNVTADPTEQGRSIGAEHCEQAIRALKDTK